MTLQFLVKSLRDAKQELRDCCWIICFNYKVFCLRIYFSLQSISLIDKKLGLQVENTSLPAEVLIMYKAQAEDAQSIVTEIVADVWGKSKDKQCFSAGKVVSLFPNYCN